MSALGDEQPRGRGSARWRPFILPLATLMIAALGLRVVGLYYAHRLPFFTHYRLDAAVYHQAGLAIQGGDWLLGAEPFHISPLYCYLVGLAYTLFGAGPWTMRVLQLLAGLVIVLLIWDSSRRLFGERLGWLAGIVACCYGPFIFFEEQLLVATTSTLLHALFLWWVIKTAQTRGSRRRSWLMTGLLLGLAALARPNALLLFFPVIVLLWLRRKPESIRRQGLHLAAAVAGCVLVILPATLRNIVVAHEFVLLQDKGGINFYVGNGPEANGTFIAPRAMPQATSVMTQVALFRATAEQEAGRSLKAAEVDSFWYAKTWEAIRLAPLRWLRLLLFKLQLYWNGQELANNYDYAFARTINPLLGLPLIQFFFLAPLAALGTLLLLWRRPPEQAFVGWLNLTLCASVVMFFVLARYRLVALPSLVLAAMAGLQLLHQLWRQRSWFFLLTFTSGLLLFALLAYVPLLEKPVDDELFKLGYAYHVQERIAEAEQAYQAALAVNADNLSARKNLALLFERQHRREKAIAAWRAVLRIAARRGAMRYRAEAAQHLSRLEAF